MKSNVTSFDDYIEKSNSVSLHPSMEKLVEGFPDSIGDLQNIIFYGPKGIGKYTQVLSTIKKYSPSGLKYEKKMIKIRISSK
jgi:replication-associated recombination protein RarA